MRSAAPSTNNQAPSSAARMLTWAAVVMIVLSLPLILNFLGRLQAESRMSAEVTRRSEQIQKDETTLTQLRSALEYAKSDAFTERYAREQAHLAKPGEVVVVPPSMQDPYRTRKAWWEEFIGDASVTPTPVPAATTSANGENR